MILKETTSQSPDWYNYLQTDGDSSRGETFCHNVHSTSNSILFSLAELVRWHSDCQNVNCKHNKSVLWDFYQTRTSVAPRCHFVLVRILAEWCYLYKCLSQTEYLQLCYSQMDWFDLLNEWCAYWLLVTHRRKYYIFFEWYIYRKKRWRVTLLI